MERIQFNFVENYQANTNTLHNIMCSYRGGILCLDMDIYTMFLKLIVNGDLLFFEENYEYNTELDNNLDVYTIYKDVARHTRWKWGGRFPSSLESVRLNAIKEFLPQGTPTYENGYIYYDSIKAAVFCENLNLQKLFQLFSDDEIVQNIYTFPSFMNVDNTHSYYKITTTKIGRKVMAKYLDEQMKKMYDILNKTNCVIPIVSTGE